MRGLSGLQLQAISSLFQACMIALAKILATEGIPIFQIVFCRSIVTWMFSSCLCYQTSANPLKSDK